MANQPPTLSSASFSSILLRDANLWARAKVRALLPWATALCSSLEKNSVWNDPKRKERLNPTQEGLKHPKITGRVVLKHKMLGNTEILGCFSQ